MATELVLGFRDNRPLGTVAEVQTLLSSHMIRFRETRSGLEQLRIAKERGIELPPALTQGLDLLPPLLEGAAEGPGWHIFFGLGQADPITQLVIEPRSFGGDAQEMDRGVAAIEAALGTKFRVHGDQRSIKCRRWGVPVRSHRDVPTAELLLAGDRLKYNGR